MPVPELRGIIAATVLPMNGSFRIDTPALERYIEWLLGEGVHGVAVNVDTDVSFHGGVPPFGLDARVVVLPTQASPDWGRPPPSNSSIQASPAYLHKTRLRT